MSQRCWTDRRTEEADSQHACKRMRLEYVSFQDFSILEGNWKTPGRRDEELAYARIINPIVSENARELIINLVRNPFVDEIAVCDGPEIVICEYAKKINEEAIGRFLSAIARVESDTDLLKIRLKKLPLHMAKRADRAVIYFARKQGMFVAYKAIIPPEQRSIMRIDTRTPNKKHLAVCDPPPQLLNRLQQAAGNRVH